MGKKCIICGDEAKLQIKGTSDFYCDDCAAEQFDDLSVLVSVEEQAKRIKGLVDEHLEEEPPADEQPEEKE
jgi:hypothetical protein